MFRWSGGLNFLLLLAAIGFIYTQVRLFKAQSEYADKVAAAGSSFGQFFNQYLKPISLNGLPIDWKSMNLTYLMKDNFVHHFASLVKGANPIYGTDFVLKLKNIDGDVRIQYRDQQHFEDIARHFGIFEEWKDGVPRTAYKGVVVFRYKSNKRVFLVGLVSLEQLGIQND